MGTNLGLTYGVTENINLVDAEEIDMQYQNRSARFLDLSDNDMGLNMIYKSTGGFSIGAGVKQNVFNYNAGYQVLGKIGYSF